MSTEIFKDIIDKNNIDNFTNEDQIMIKNLIKCLQVVTGPYHEEYKGSANLLERPKPGSS